MLLLLIIVQFPHLLKLFDLCLCYYLHAFKHFWVRLYDLIDVFLLQFVQVAECLRLHAVGPLLLKKY